MITNLREQKGKEIANKNDLLRLDENTYRVRSQTNSKIYNVVKTQKGWICDCPDHIFRKICCKHIHAVEFSLKVREQVRKENTTIISPISDISSCLYCKSDKITKDGLRHNKHYDIQKFYCKDCNHYFTINIGFEKMKLDPKGITTAMQLYFSGESLRNVAKSLRLLGMDVSYQTVYNWIKKYVGLMEKYLDQITPQVSDTWRSDELFLKIKGDTKYLYALMDDDTRYILAQQVANTKFKEDIQQLFKEGKRVAQKKPLVLITDGAKNFHQAYMKEFRTIQNPRTKHIQHIHFKGDKNNNKMERLNGEIRDREKVMRGLKKMNTPIIEGYRIYHNYIRNHQGLDGKTPADVSGIKIEGENKWITIIQNAKRNDG